MLANFSVSFILSKLLSIYFLLRFSSSTTSLAILVNCIAIPKLTADSRAFFDLTFNTFAIIKPTVPATL